MRSRPAPLPSTRSACAYSASPDSSTHPQSTAKHPSIPAPCPISTESSRCASAFPRISALGFAIEPNLYSCILKQVRIDRPRLHPMLLLQRLDRRQHPPSLRQIPQHMQRHRRTRARQRDSPRAASLNFSSIVVAAAACTNFPNRVPVFANPHEGTSIRKPSSASHTRLRIPFGCPSTVDPHRSILPLVQVLQTEIYSLLKQEQIAPFRCHLSKYFFQGPKQPESHPETAAHALP